MGRWSAVQLRILRLERTLDKTGQTKSPLYDDASKGLFTMPVKIGPRASGWPEHEVDQIIAARIAGAGDAEIKKLVQRLHEQRKSVVAHLVGA